MKTIVAPTDFSTISRNAVNYAADLACAIGINLSLLHVCPVSVVVGELPVPAYNTLDFISDAEEMIGRLKEDIIQRTGGRIKVYTEILEGDITMAINHHCKTVHPYAVVMGTESGSSFERFIFGGKTISAIHHLSWPVIVVPPGAKFSSIRKVGLACDLNDVIHTVPLEEIKSIVKELGASLQVLYVRPENGNVFTNEKIVESGWLHMALEDLHPLYHYVRGDNIEEKICEFAEENKLDLLIIVPKEHALLNSIFVHSHSKAVVLHTHVPVMAIHE